MYTNNGLIQFYQTDDDIFNWREWYFKAIHYDELQQRFQKVQLELQTKISSLEHTIDTLKFSLIQQESKQQDLEKLGQKEKLTSDEEWLRKFLQMEDRFKDSKRKVISLKQTIDKMKERQEQEVQEQVEKLLQSVQETQVQQMKLNEKETNNELNNLSYMQFNNFVCNQFKSVNVLKKQNDDIKQQLQNKRLEKKLSKEKQKLKKENEQLCQEQQQLSLGQISNISDNDSLIFEDESQQFESKESSVKFLGANIQSANVSRVLEKSNNNVKNQFQKKSQFAKQKEKQIESQNKSLIQKTKDHPSIEKKATDQIKPKKDNFHPQQFNKTKIALKNQIPKKMLSKNPSVKLQPAIMIEKGIQTDFIQQKQEKQASPKQMQQQQQQQSLSKEQKQNCQNKSNPKLIKENKFILPDLVKSSLISIGIQTTQLQLNYKTVEQQTVKKELGDKFTQTDQETNQERQQNIQNNNDQISQSTTFFQSTNNHFYPQQQTSLPKQSVFSFLGHKKGEQKKINLKLQKNSQNLIPEFAQTARLPPTSSTFFNDQKILSVGSDQQLKEIFSNFKEQANTPGLLSDPVSQSMVFQNSAFKKLSPSPIRHLPGESLGNSIYFSFGDQQNQTQIDNKPSFEQFKQFLSELHQVHSKKCGNNCIHLKRFYEKLGLANTWNKKLPYDIHQKVINKLPNIWGNKESLQQKKGSFSMNEVSQQVQFEN